MEPTKEGEAVTGGVKAVVGPVVQIDEGRIQAHLDKVVQDRWAALAATGGRLRVCVSGWVGPGVVK